MRDTIASNGSAAQPLTLALATADDADVTDAAGLFVSTERCRGGSIDIIPDPPGTLAHP
jgi:hypothetical protein